MYLATTSTSTNNDAIIAQPTSKGFFGLSELRDFCGAAVEPFVKAGKQTELVLDFSLVRIWDIAAALWLVIALHHYKHNAGMKFKLRLPEGRSDMSPEDRVDFDKSADYLRRWQFEKALANIVPDTTDILVKEQRDYFKDGPQKFYRNTQLKDDRGLLQALVSRRLVQIRNLAEISSTGVKSVTSDRIAECVASFQSERIGDILFSQCGIEKRKGDLFADHLLTEALMNVKEHPDATIGMVAISVMGSTKEIILSVVDNGKYITETLYERWYNDHKNNETYDEHVPNTYERSKLQSNTKADIVIYSTEPGVTCKDDPSEPDAGMGLTYIKNDTLDEFDGKLQLISDSLSIIFKKNSNDNVVKKEWPHSWRGNLMRIAIPLSSLKA